MRATASCDTGVSIREWLAGLTFARYRIKIRFQTAGALPSYKGSTLRGGFGVAFRRLACSRRRQSCEGCDRRDECVYSQVFETRPPSGSTRLRLASSVPRPFVIEPPLSRQRDFREGDELDFGLVLIGRAVRYLPYFILAFERLGERGLGKDRAAFSVDEVQHLGVDGSGHVIYSGDDGGLTHIPPRAFETPAYAAAGFGDHGITVNFVTPTRLKSNGRICTKPSFEILIRALLRRVSSLLYFHCDSDTDIDYTAYCRLARDVRTADDGTKWVDWSRYSTRQGRSMDLGGFVGKVRFEGEMQPFLPLLSAGTFLHVGKGCVFGLGRYEVLRG